MGGRWGVGGGRRGIFDGTVAGSLKLREEVKNKKKMGKELPCHIASGL